MHGTTFFPDLPSLARMLGGEVTHGQVRAPGPGHSPADRSMMVKLDANAPDGFVVFSHAGDDPLVCKDYIRQRCGLPTFGSGGAGRRPRASSEDIAALVANAVESQRREKKANVVAAYDYTNGEGALLYQVVRLEPKNFRQRRPDGNGGWIWKIDDTPRVLYRWQELLQFPDATVFVTEGEKDADRVASLGHCATTVACGKWTDDCVNALAGRDVLILEDNDEAGRKKALEAAQVLHEVAKTIRIVRLPDLPEKGDVSDWLDANLRNAGKFVDVCFEAPVWNAAAETEAATSTETAVPPAKAEEAPITFLHLVDWHNKPVPERPWLVRDRIPLDNVTLLSGEGSVGKTILSLQLAVATVLARDWLSTMPEPGPVIAVCCEDDADELHRRLDAIRRHYGADFTELADLRVLSLAGQDALFATPNRSGLMVPTKLFAQITAAACDIKPRLILLDNSADVFGGNENDRAQVRQFIAMLRGLAMAAGAGLVLTSHPSLTGVSSGTGLSGSTAWNASVRSRLYFKRATTAKDEEPDPDMRILEVMKANYGPVGETITLRWKDGLFLPVPKPGSLEQLARERKLEDLFLTLLDRWIDQGRNVSEKKSANNYAPSRFVGEPEAKADKVTKRELTDAMERLFRAGKMHVATYGFASRGWNRIERK
jgi:RecA-family ATPase/5S rRNA maturation endonuclease (ribonuclease M5)